MPRHTPSPNAKLVPAKIAAAEVGIPYTTLRGVVFRGELYVVKVGRAWYFQRKDLDAWIANQRERLCDQPWDDHDPPPRAA